MTDPVSLFRLILRRPRRRFLLGSTIWTVFAVLWIAVQAPPVDAPRAEPGVLYLPDTAIVIDDGYNLSIQGVLGAIIIILVALGLWLRGHYDYPSGSRSRALVGFITLGFVGWVLLANFEPEGTYGINRWTIYLIVPFVCGLLGALVMPCTLHLYLLLLGGLGGLAAGLWILGWRDNLSIQSDWGRAVLLVLLCLFGCMLAGVDQFFHVVGASLTGSYMLMLAMDIFFHTGFTYCFLATLDANPHHDYTYRTTRETYIIQGVLIVAVVIGFIVQMWSRNIYEQHMYYYPNNKAYWPAYLWPAPNSSRWLPWQRPVSG